MRKRGMILVLVCSLCLLLAGCGQSGGPAEGEEETPLSQQPVEDVLPEVEEEQPATGTPDAEIPLYEDNFSVDAAAAAAFAGKIQIVVAEEDLEGLADLASYPLYVGSLEESAFVESREELIALGTEKIFTEELLSEIAGADIDGLEPSKAGFSLSKSGRPNIVFGVVDGRLAIVGMNY